MNPPSSEQIRYALVRVENIANKKHEALNTDGRPSNSLAHEAVAALQESGRKPTLLPRHQLVRNLVAALANGKGCLQIQDLVRVPHKILQEHRRWVEGNETRQGLHLQIIAKQQTLEDGLNLGTITPQDAITEMEAFTPEEAPAKAKKAKPEKKAKEAPPADEGDADEPVADADEAPAAKPKHVRKPTPKKPKDLL